MADKKLRERNMVGLDADVHKAVKIKAATEGRFVEEVVNDSLRKVLKLPEPLKNIKRGGD